MATFNMNNIHLQDVEFFCDERLDKINVYSVVLVYDCFYSDVLVSDFCKRMVKISCIQMIQEDNGNFTRFTFVSHVNAYSFSKFLFKIVCELEFLYHCKIAIY